MKKNNLYIVFDQIPSTKSGGLVATYINLVNLLNDIYNIEVISIFDCPKVDKIQFENQEIYVINKKYIDIRFYRMFKYLKQLKFKSFLKSLFSLLYYFLCIPCSKRKIKKIIDSQNVIVSSPSAAIFMPKIPFILEFHSDYKYFYGDSILGRLQTMLMETPTLALFRSKDSSDKSPEKLNSSYIYNFFDNSNITPKTKEVKNRIIYMGRFEKAKNPIRLIELAAMLRDEIDDFTLDIYGAGTMKSIVEDKIKELNLRDKVFLKGFTRDKNIYSNYSVMWLSSDFEGMPVTIIEAKANAVPCISSYWGDAVYEIINDKKDGYVAKNNKEFIKYTIKILSNDKLQKKLSENAYSDFKRFSKESARKNWINILNNYNRDK